MIDTLRLTAEAANDLLRKGEVSSDELYAAYRELYRALQPTHAILAGLRRQAVPTS